MTIGEQFNEQFNKRVFNFKKNSVSENLEKLKY